MVELNESDWATKPPDLLIPSQMIADRIYNHPYPQVTHTDAGTLPRWHSVAAFSKWSLAQILLAAQCPNVAEIIKEQPSRLGKQIEEARDPHYEAMLEIRSKIGNFVHDTIPKLGTPAEPVLWGMGKICIDHFKKWQGIHSIESQLTA